MKKLVPNFVETLNDTFFIKKMSTFESYKFKTHFNLYRTISLNSKKFY